MCLIGQAGTFTPLQLEALLDHCRRAYGHFGIPMGDVLGHCEIGNVRSELATTKTCPDLDMHELRGALFSDEKRVDLLEQAWLEWEAAEKR